MRKALSVVVAAAATTLLSFGIAGPATAGTAHPMMCGNTDDLEIGSHTSYHIPAAGQSFTDGPGGTMTVSVTKSSTITYTLGASAEFSIDTFFAQVKTTVSASVSRSSSITVGHTYSHNISAHKYGHLVYGSWGYHVHWNEYRLSGQYCQNATLIHHGTATVPTNSVGWKYTETN